MRIGIIGAGQLGQMLGFSARDLGAECVFLDPGQEPPAAASGEVIQAAFDDAAALAALATRCDVITYEFENVPVAALQDIEGSTAIYPPVAALRYSQDRLSEKQLFDRLGIPLPQFRVVDTRTDLDKAADELGLPVVIKTRRFGYDGKGQYLVRSDRDLDAAWSALKSVPLIAEQWVSFDYEISCIGVRSIAGDIAIYPLTENVHRKGILRTSRSPVDAPALHALASEYVRCLLEHLDYVGVLALELFVVGNELLANEYAPRVHNSGHWTIEGSATSQFENHLRAIMGLSLGPTTSLGHAAMINLIGCIPDFVHTLEGFTLHDYGKAPRTNRKLGHITAVEQSAARADERGEKIDNKCDAVDTNN